MSSQWQDEIEKPVGLQNRWFLHFLYPQTDRFYRSSRIEKPVGLQNRWFLHFLYSQTDRFYRSFRIEKPVGFQIMPKCISITGMMIHAIAFVLFTFIDCMINPTDIDNIKSNMPFIPVKSKIIPLKKIIMI